MLGSDVLKGIILVIVLWILIYMIPRLKEKPDYRERVYAGKKDSGRTTAEKIDRIWHKNLK